MAHVTPVQRSFFDTAPTVHCGTRSPSSRGDRYTPVAEMQGVETDSSVDDTWIEVRSSKKCHERGAGTFPHSVTLTSKTVIAALAERLTAVFVPLIAGQNITELSGINVSQALEKQCSGYILDLRYHLLLNMIAVHTRNGITT